MGVLVGYLQSLRGGISLGKGEVASEGSVLIWETRGKSR